MSDETAVADAPEQAAEFPSDEHRASHINALLAEKAGYEAKAEGLAKKGESQLSDYYKGRAGEVADELKRLGADAKKPSARAEQR